MVSRAPGLSDGPANSRAFRRNIAHDRFVAYEAAQME